MNPLTSNVSAGTKMYPKALSSIASIFLSTYLAPSTLHGNKLDFFTKSDLKYEQYEYYPRPLPDVHFYLKTKEGRKEYFLDIFEDNQPFFVLIRRIKKYLEYAGSGEWNGDTLQRSC